jgi:hypothetical protein
MKTNREILIIMRDHKDLFYSGLCKLVINCKLCLLISTEEEMKILRYISHNKPKKDSPLFDKEWNNEIGYYWSIYEWAPRERWLNYHIKKLTKSPK